MVIHQLVVNSCNKILPRLKANAIESANLRASWFVLYLLSTSCVLTLAYSTLFSSRGYSTAAQFLLTRESSPRATRSTRTFRRSSPSRHPCGALLSFGEFFLSYLYFASAVSDIFIINVINNIRIRFIISFYVICAVIYCSFCCIYV